MFLGKSECGKTHGLSLSGNRRLGNNLIGRLAGRSGFNRRWRFSRHGSRFSGRGSFRCQLGSNFSRPAMVSVAVAASPAGSGFFRGSFLSPASADRRGLLGRFHPAIGKFQNGALMNQPVQIHEHRRLFRRGFGRGGFGRFRWCRCGSTFAFGGRRGRRPA